MPFLKRGAFLTSILENKDSMDTLRRLVCLFAEEYRSRVTALPRSRVTAHSFGKQQASFVAIVAALVYNYIHNYQHLLTREPQNEIHNILMT